MATKVNSQITEVTIYQAAEILGLSPNTIRRWEKKKLIRGKPSQQHQRLFDLQELSRVQNKYLGKEPNPPFQVFKNQETEYSIIELFSGCGGMALGFENAGLQNRLLVEIDKDCIATLKKNRPNWQAIHQSVSEIDFKPYKNQVDIVAGGSPCQSFSYAGLGKGFDDIRGTLFFELARSIAEIQPKIAVVENVRGLIQHDSGKTLKVMLKTLENLGYKPAYKLLKSQFLDVPQKRERIIIIGVRQDLKMPIIFPQEKDYTISLREALKNCPPSIGYKYAARKQQIMELIPPGGYWRDLPIEIQKEYMQKSFYLGGGKTGMARRLSWDEPSLTITCSPCQKQTERCHPEETRPLTVREYARIQTFPDEWEFAGSLSSQYKQIGNAVPVNLAYHLGRCLIKMLAGSFDEISTIIEQDQYFAKQLELAP
jgi:DNA (cytosine-5)-methyltransferase 1